MDTEVLEIVEKHKTPCVIGSISDSDPCHVGCSKKGGFPDVSEDFNWPTFRGKHLSFVAQIEARHFLKNEAPGILSFFWNERNWGGSIKDKGAFRVLYTKLPTTRLKCAPKTEYKALGLFNRTHTPTIWKEECLDFRDSFCLPPIERLEHFNYDWDCDRDDLYFREMETLSSFLRIGGLPDPVQNDDMECDCARIHGREPAESWKLLLEIDSKSDMMWGDAGKLYWFIHKDDLSKSDFSKAWMQMQCY